jgi:cobalt-zinc-cadmium efflux system protein
LAEGHSHSHHHASPAGRLGLALALVALFAVVEVVGGLLAGSLALLADAGHMVSDVGALGLALFALWYARRPHDERRTYGYHRTEVLAALTNGGLLLVLGAWIVTEAFERLRSPTEVWGGTMMLVASAGLVVNLVAFLILHRRGEENINLRGAVLHVIGDTLGSVAAITAGILVWWRDWRWADPALSLFIALIIGWSAVRLVRESVDILMEGVPPGLDVKEIEASIAAVDEVLEVHDLHVWTISSGIHALSAHVRVADPGRGPEVILRIDRVLEDRFGLTHTTIQVEATPISPEAHRLPVGRG